MGTLKRRTVLKSEDLFMIAICITVVVLFTAALDAMFVFNHTVMPMLAR